MALTRKKIFCLLLVAYTQCILLEAESSENDDVVIEDNVADIEIKTATYKSPEPAGPILLAENFDNKEKFQKLWIQSLAKKDDTVEEIAKYDGIWTVEEPKRNVEDGNLGLVLKSKARHAAISTLLNKPFLFEDKPLVVQYEVIFQEGQECGGAYLKLLSVDSQHKNLKMFHDKTPYTIMFGPDKCGNDHKLHFIFRHKNPLNGSIEEKHAKKPKERLEDFFKDKHPHLYTLVVHPDNTFVIKVDGNIVNEGSLLDDFTPPVNPPLEIEDPNDKRPDDWDEREKIPDPTAAKPEDWDEDAPAQIVDENDKIPEGWLENESPTIPNPESVKPDDWDEDMDGEWEPPEIQNPKCVDAPGCGPYKKRLISNPQYKGKWLPPLINNPNYQGKWKPKLIHNPNYFNDDNPFKMTPIYAVGFELWSMSPDILFDNIIVTDDELVAKKWAEDTFDLRKQRIAIESESWWGKMMKMMNYKPGWWAAYFIYCAIPICIYVCFLISRARESGLWQGIVNFTAEHPWIWTVYIILLGLPVMLIIYCCCFTSQDKDANKEDEAEAETEALLQKDKEDEAEAETEALLQKDKEGETEAEALIQKDKEDTTAEDNVTKNKAEEFVEEQEEKEEQGTDEVIVDSKEPSTSAEGPRRRKPNKE